ncbi:Histone deacetylase HDT1 [Dendrobium catenatum]|uniref:Histone deacetylase HDT1 n=1 Tax=Dendrobium catenatum TaxID=906689 RepID=A0A2I0X9M9_9ASPA|nr:Histone deacetylase HDT1 [Dendrobium catenatum]
MRAPTKRVRRRRYSVSQGSFFHTSISHNDCNKICSLLLKVENIIKRKADSASKTPVPEKKAKLVTPAGTQKTGGDGKKSVHIATPHPSKLGGKPQQSPKSGGTAACKSCNRSASTHIHKFLRVYLILTFTF